MRDVRGIVANWTALMNFHKPYDRRMYQYRPNYVSVYKKFLKKQLSSRKAAVFVAEGRNRIVGYAMVKRGNLPLIYLFNREAYVVEIFVADKHRGKGVGTRLLSEAENWAREGKCHWLALNSHAKNKRAIKVYKGCGFRDHHLKLSKFLV